jgi:hypothetical protein
VRAGRSGALVRVCPLAGAPHRPAHYGWRGSPAVQPRSCTTSRLRCSSVRLNSRTAAASAASRLGACTSPSTCAFLRISDARQEREAAARGLLADCRVRGRDDIATKHSRRFRERVESGEGRPPTAFDGRARLASRSASAKERAPAFWKPGLAVKDRPSTGGSRGGPARKLSDCFNGSRAPAACFTAWGSPGGPAPCTGGWGVCGPRPLRQKYNSRADQLFRA